MFSDVGDALPEGMMNNSGKPLIMLLPGDFGKLPKGWGQVLSFASIAKGKA